MRFAVKRTRVLAGIAGVAVAALLMGGFAVWHLLFRDDAPPAVDLGRAARAIDDPAPTGSAPGGTGLEGRWMVDSSIGSFQNFTSSFVGYRVEEQLVGIGTKTAVGRTPKVQGTLSIDGTAITSVDVRVDMSTLASDDSRRDNQMRTQALETDRFPTASFALTRPIELGTLPPEGAVVDLDATGTLTLHGTSREVVIDLQTRRERGVIAVTGKLTVAFADYGIQRPRSFSVLSVEDKGIVELQLFFRPT